MRRYCLILCILLVACSGGTAAPTGTASPTVVNTAVASPITPAPFVSTVAPTPTAITPATAPATIVLTAIVTQVVTVAAPAATNTSIPAPTSTTVPVPLTAVPDQYQLTASVSNSSPRDNTTVAVSATLLRNGAGVAGATMETTWHYKTTTSACAGGPSGNDGVMSCARQISRATVGFTVRIDVRVTYQGKVYTASTSFTPQ